MQNNERVNRITNKRAPCLPFFALCALIIGVLGVLPLLPSSITQILRPAFICSCLIAASFSYYPMSFAVKLQIATIVYYTLVFALNRITSTSFMEYASTVMYIMMFIFAAQIRWTTQEIRLIINAAVVSCLWMAIVTVYSNPSILHSSGSSHIYYFGIQMNRNSIAFELVPGALGAMLMLLYNKHYCKIHRTRTLFYGISCVIIAFVIFAIGCRSAFYSAVAGLSLIIWSKTGTGITGESRLIYRILVICFVLAVSVFAMSLSSGTYSERLFEFGGEESDSGRGELAEQAWAMIDEKPIFGGGFDYWNDCEGDSLGTHNTFLTIMVFSGYVGGIFLAVFLISFLLEMLKAKNLVPIAFSIQTLFFIKTESDMSYYAYIPLLLAFIILRYIQHQNKNIVSIFD